jgi:hypothetical protein
MKTIFITLSALVIVAALSFNQWQLQRELARLRANSHSASPDQSNSDNALAKFHEAEARLDEARAQFQNAERRFNEANARLAALENRPATTLDLSGRRPLVRTSRIAADELTEPVGMPAQPQKRSWGPEQAVGEPDTMQSGDLPTAWAPLQPDGGDEWLKLEYEKSVDVAEVRVRETHNPGAISKVTAFLANGSEVTLWEGVEPKAEAPVEMSFTVPDNVHAKSIKVYLDTKRVPGWNEIDAVQLIGRDGSQQWAKQASASSTYAQPRGANRLVEFEGTTRF